MIIFVIIFEIIAAILLIKFLTDKTEQIIELTNCTDVTSFAIKYNKFKRILHNINSNYKKKIILENLEYQTKKIINLLELAVVVGSFYDIFKKIIKR